MEELDIAIRLRKEGNLEESNRALVNLSNDNPNNSIINYQCAWSLDVMGLEREAVPYYKKAIVLGLPDDDLKGAFLGLGSTYRTLGEYEKSRKIFEEGLAKFPDNNAFKTFYAMTLYNLKEYPKAMEILLNNLVQTSSDEDIIKYKKAIEFYSDKLDKVW